MLQFEAAGPGRFQVWVVNQHGREPLGDAVRDAGGQWYYRPLAGSYLYAGALAYIADRLEALELLSAQLVPEQPAREGQEPEQPAAEQAPRRQRLSVLEVADDPPSP